MASDYLKLEKLARVFIEDEKEFAEFLSNRLIDRTNPPKNYFFNSLGSFKSFRPTTMENYIFIVDIRLKGLPENKDGLNVIKKIREMEVYYPVIVFSAHISKKESKKYGADFFFRKLEDDIKTVLIPGMQAIIDSIQEGQKTVPFLEKYGGSEIAQDFDEFLERRIKFTLPKMAQSSHEVKGITPITNSNLYPELPLVISQKLIINPMKGQEKTAGHIYLSKKILTAHTPTDRKIWVAGNRVWEIEFSQESNKSGNSLNIQPGEKKDSTLPETTIKTAPEVSYNNLQFEIKFDSITLFPTSLSVIQDYGKMYEWDLTSLDKIDETFQTNFNYDFSNLPRYLEVLFNIMIAQACAQEYIKENGNNLKAKYLGNKLDSILGKLEIQKWLSTYYARELNLEWPEIKDRQKFWLDSKSFPEVIEIFDGRLRTIKKKKEIGIVELKSLYTGKKFKENFDYNILKQNQILKENACFLFTAYEPREGSPASDIEPQDYVSTG